MSKILQITRGASAILTYYLPDYLTVDNLNQVTFMLKHLNTMYSPLKMFDADGEFNTGWSYDESYNSISLMLGSSDTANLELADDNDPMEFEVVLDLDTDQLGMSEDSVIIEPQLPILVADSIYSEYARESGTSEDTPTIRLLKADKVQIGEYTLDETTVGKLLKLLSAMDVRTESE